MKELPKLLADRWTARISGWLESLDREDDDVDVEVFRQYLAALSEFLEHVAAEATPREKWEVFRSGAAVTLRSKKLAHDFSVEVNDILNSVRLSASLTCSQHLPKMTDDFWRTVLELNNYGHLAFSSNTCSTSSKSVTWAIMQDYVALAGAPMEGGGNNPFVDAGTLELSWPLRNGIEVIYVAAIGALRRVYHLNYLLYRYEYILCAARLKGKRNGGGSKCYQ